MSTNPTKDELKVDLKNGTLSITVDKLIQEIENAYPDSKNKKQLSAKLSAWYSLRELLNGLESNSDLQVGTIQDELDRRIHRDHVNLHRLGCGY